MPFSTIWWGMRSFNSYVKIILEKWLTLVLKKQASTFSMIEKRSHYLKKVVHLCYNRLYLKNFKEK